MGGDFGAIFRKKPWAIRCLKCTLIYIYIYVYYIYVYVYEFFCRSGLCKLWSVPDCELIRTLKGTAVDNTHVLVHVNVQVLSSLRSQG